MGGKIYRPRQPASPYSTPEIANVVDAAKAYFSDLHAQTRGAGKDEIPLLSSIRGLRSEQRYIPHIMRFLAGLGGLTISDEEVTTQYSRLEKYRRPPEQDSTQRIDTVRMAPELEATQHVEHHPVLAAGSLLVRGLAEEESSARLIVSDAVLALRLHLGSQLPQQLPQLGAAA